jgi:hypothetical protein
VDSRFQGESLNKVDGKGRISLPAKFRRALQSGDSRCGPGDPARLYIAYGNPTTDFVECLSGDYLRRPDGAASKTWMTARASASCSNTSIS